MELNRGESVTGALHQVLVGLGGDAKGKR